MFLLSDDQKKALAAAAINAEAKAAKSLLQKRRGGLADYEVLLESMHAFRQLSFEQLGKGHSRGG